MTPASMSLLEAGEKFEFLGLRQQGQSLMEVVTSEREWPVKVITVFSISATGSLTIRIDDIGDEMSLEIILESGLLPKSDPNRSYLHSLPLDLAEKMVEQRIWIPLEAR